MKKFPFGDWSQEIHSALLMIGAYSKMYDIPAKDLELMFEIRIAARRVLRGRDGENRQFSAIKSDSP